MCLSCLYFEDTLPSLVGGKSLVDPLFCMLMLGFAILDLFILIAPLSGLIIAMYLF